MDLFFTRREFLKGSGTFVLCLEALCLNKPEAYAQQILKPYPYRTWEELYRDIWTWDRVVKGTHSMINCRANCSWNLYIKDGIVWREEQSCNYPGPENEKLVDFNPSGCQKGAMFSHLVYAPYRIKYPLKRIGQRGEGKWKRISWNEALDEIATKLLQVLKDHGCETIFFDTGSTQAFGAGPSGMSRLRFFDLIGSPNLDGWSEENDLNYGAAVTYGQAHVDGTMDDCLNSEFILIWTMNPTYTHIPYMHFMLEARYNGAKIACISPDYSASSIHADYWIAVAPGADAALALSMAHVIVKEKLYDEAHIKEQTDLPFLIRQDNGRFLREKDLLEQGSNEVFYVWDLEKNILRKAPGAKGSNDKSLKLGDMDPAIEGSWEVKLLTGEKVKISPVFEHLKSLLENYSPDAASNISKGPGPKLIERVAGEFARAKSAMIFASWGANKNYHSDLANRAKALLLALCGHIGKPGCGFRSTVWWWPEESVRLAFPASLGKGRSIRVGSSALFYKYHCGLKEILGKDEWSDQSIKRPMEDYIQESLKKGWMRLYPPLDKTPKIWFTVGANALRRQRAHHLWLEHFWPKLELVVGIDFRMNNTLLHSDIILPAATQYEKTDLKYQLSYSPYFCFQEKAIDPLYESKDEWEIFSLLAQKIQDKAKEAGFTEFYEPLYEETRNISSLYDEFSLNGKFGPKADPDEFMQYLLDRSPLLSGIGVNDLKKRGIIKVKGSGPWCYPSGKAFEGPFYSLGLNSPLKEGQAITPFQYYTEEKRPWPTLTGRQQFYIDHEWFLELGEQLPIHKEPPKIGGYYPFIISGGHTRWSIHNTWRDHPYMLRLQRGGPVMYMNDQDAKKLGIKDNDLVKVSNDVGSFMINVKTSPAVRPGVVIVYHAWDPNQHIGKRNQQSVMPGAIKPSHLVGGYGHIFLDWAHCAPGLAVRETRVKIEKV